MHVGYRQFPFVSVYKSAVYEQNGGVAVSIDGHMPKEGVYVILGSFLRSLGGHLQPLFERWLSSNKGGDVKIEVSLTSSDTERRHRRHRQQATAVASGY